MESTFFWLLWSATAGICVWKMAEGFLRPKLILEWPFLACAMWSYFYGYKAFAAKLFLNDYLTHGSEILGQFIPLQCLIAILLGWRYAKQSKKSYHPTPSKYSGFIAWLIGSALLLIGAWGNFSVMRVVASGSLHPEEASAYWYLLFYVGFPGLTIALWSLLKKPPIPLRLILWIILALELLIFMFPQVFTVRRGPLFSAVIILLLTPPLTRRKPPNPIIFCGGLAIVAMAMLLFVQARNTLYRGGSWSDTIAAIDLGDILKEQGDQPDDNEYINNCEVISTIFHNGKYQYGTGDLGLFLHWIPRSMWPSKPNLGEGYYSDEELFGDIAEDTGDRLLGHGAATGGVATSFLQYGFLCPFFWFGLSWAFGKVYARIHHQDDPRWLFCYVGFMCASHWLVSQSFAAAFVPGMCFQAIPFLVFTAFGGLLKTKELKSKVTRTRTPARILSRRAL